MEKDLFTGSEISKCPDVVANCSENQLANIERDNKSMSSNVENSMLFTIQSVVFIVPKNTGHILRDLEEMNSYRIGTPEDV